MFQTKRYQSIVSNYIFRRLLGLYILLLLWKYSENYPFKFINSFFSINDLIKYHWITLCIWMAVVSLCHIFFCCCHCFRYFTLSTSPFSILKPSIQLINRCGTHFPFKLCSINRFFVVCCRWLVIEKWYSSRVILMGRHFSNWTKSNWDAHCNNTQND